MCLIVKLYLRYYMSGLDAVGKTTLLYRMKLGEVVQPISTIGKLLNINLVNCGYFSAK